MRHKYILALCLIFLAVSSGLGEAPQQKKKHVIVYNLKALNGYPGGMAEIMSDAIVNVLNGSQKFLVRDEKTTFALIEQIKQAQSGVTCDTHEETCDIDNARAIKADYIVIGGIGKLEEGNCIINIRVVSAANGTTVYPQETICQCASAAMLPIIKEMAGNIVTFLVSGKKTEPPKPIEIGDHGAGIPPPPPPPPPLSPPEGPVPPPLPGKGAIHVQTTPSGAKILLDGKNVEEKGISPLTINNVEAGEHLITALMSGYAQGKTTVTVVEGQTAEANISLKASVGAIRVITRPAGADVSLDNKPMGKTPITIPNLSPGEYQLAITKDGYNNLVKKIIVNAGETKEINEILAVLTGEADITSNPSGANLWLDGKYLGKTPKQLPALTIGKHQIKLTLVNYKDYIGEFTVEGNKRISVPIELTGLPGNIIISSTPDGADVYIDGKKVGVAPYNGPLPPGNHQVRVSMNGYQSAEETVTIEPNKPKTLDLTLKKGPDIRGDMVMVPAGEFMMGCNSKVDKQCAEAEDEKPYHKVYLDAFYIDKFEVTVQQYGACVQAGNCSNPNTGGACNWGVSGRETHPINCIDWNQADTFCKWAGKRLPTEAEWEKAARGTDGRKYPWGNREASCSYAVMWENGQSGCGKNSTWPVGSKPSGASPYGAMDMAGNVWEWVADWYGANYYQSSPRSNPTDTASGTGRVLRGGGWDDSPLILRPSLRLRFDPSSRSDFLGVRCAR